MEAKDVFLEEHFIDMIGGGIVLLHFPPGREGIFDLARRVLVVAACEGPTNNSGSPFFLLKSA